MVTLLLSVALLSQGAVAEGKNPLEFEDEQVSMRLVLRSPEQLSAFYQGREFNQAAIDRILETCFITPIIHNKTLDALWLELDNWQFSAGGQAIKRLRRNIVDPEIKPIWQIGNGAEHLALKHPKYFRSPL